VTSDPALKILPSSRSKTIELVLLGLVAIVVFAEGYRFVTTLSGSIGAAEAGTYLLLLAGLLAALTSAYALQPARRAPAAGPEAEAGDEGRAGRHKPWIGLGLFFGYVVLLGYVDYAIATFAFLAAYLKYFGQYRTVTVLVVAAAVALGSAYLWQVLGVAMPRNGFSFF